MLVGLDCAGKQLRESLMTAKSSSASSVFLVVAVLAAVLGVTAAAVAESSNEAAARVVDEPIESPGTAVTGVGLTDAETDGILFMREEEKLARDVYLGLGALWDLRIFENIAAAEQRHMDEVLGLIDTYGLEDPETIGMVGVFENDDLQTLYDGLMMMGSESVDAAFEVGATVEEVDIADLDGYLAETMPADITTVYENLLRASRNHLRAFVAQLGAAGIEREATVLDPALYASIVSAETERGNDGSVECDGCDRSGLGGHGADSRGRGPGGGQGSDGSRGQGGRGPWGDSG
jgi:hypothetical protein